MNFSDWTPALLPALLAIIALWGPGLVITSALGVGKWRTVVFAPLASIGVISLAAITGPRIGVNWGWGLYLAAAAVATIGMLAINLLNREIRGRWHARASYGEERAGADPKVWPALVGTLVTAPFAVAASMQAIGKPEFPNQTWDAMFHLSAVRWILETGNGSTLNLSAVATSLPEADATKGGFYPAGFHDLVALTVTDNVIVATNAVVIVVSALLWPLAAAFLSSIIMPKSTAMPILTAILAASFTSFPERPASYGVLWPTVYSYAFVPLIVIALADWFGRTNERAIGFKTLVIGGLGALGIGVAHPTGFLVALLAAGMLFLDMVIRLIARTFKLSRGQVASLIATGIALLAFAVVAARHPAINNVRGWAREPVGSFFREVFGVIFESQLPQVGYGDPELDWLLGILTLIGIALALWIPRTRWLAFTYAAASYLFVNSAIVALPGYKVLSLWYADPARLGAVTPLFGAVIAGLGAWGVFELVMRAFGGDKAKKNLRTSMVGLFVVVLVVGTKFVGYNASVDQLRINYVYSDKSGFNALVSPEELEFIETLPQYVEKGDVIVGDPRTGATFIYALTGLDVSHRHINGSWGGDYTKIAERFDSVVDSSEDMCAVLARNNVRYFYTDEIIFWPEAPVGKQYGGFEKAGTQTDAFKLVASGGSAALYEITTCDFPAK
ncbi:MAG: hypothetical protein Q4E01_03835 [Actinomycetaceae bacterium]|nr:hypothetical protein [Actinomycetaceae bacterium]